MTQILFIHGGMTFKNKTDYHNYLKNKKVSLETFKYWSNQYLDKKLKKFHIIRPRMPCKDNSKYEDWKILFENYLKVTDNELILIGNSLGGIFLTKYLSENKIKKDIKGLFLVCAPFDNSLSTEDLAGGFELKKDLSKIEKQCKNIHFFFSADDPVVPISHAGKYKEKLPNAIVHAYDSKNGHFRVSKFPEIVKEIKKIKF